MPDRTLLDAMAVRIISALRDPVRGRWNGHHGLDDLEVVRAALQKCPPDRLAVTSGLSESIRAIKDRFPGVKAGLTRQHVEQTDADFIALDQSYATDEALDFCARYAVPVWVWTVDERKQMTRFIKDERVAGIITSRPDLALRLRRDRS